jgi:hypothetical protein
MGAGDSISLMAGGICIVALSFLMTLVDAGGTIGGAAMAGRGAIEGRGGGTTALGLSLLPLIAMGACIGTRGGCVATTGARATGISGRIGVATTGTRATGIGGRIGVATTGTRATGIGGRIGGRIGVATTGTRATGIGGRIGGRIGVATTVDGGGVTGEGGATILRRCLLATRLACPTAAPVAGATTTEIFGTCGGGRGAKGGGVTIEMRRRLAGGLGVATGGGRGASTMATAVRGGAGERKTLPRRRPVIVTGGGTPAIVGAVGGTGAGGGGGGGGARLTPCLAVRRRIGVGFISVGIRRVLEIGNPYFSREDETATSSSKIRGGS